MADERIRGARADSIRLEEVDQEHPEQSEASEDIDALNRFLLPGMKVCTAKVTPVSDHPMPGSASGSAGSGAG